MVRVVPQLPMPSQVAGSWSVDGPTHSAGMQTVVLSAKTQAPVLASQSTEPQGVLTFEQAAAQQWPVPAMPQIPERQSSFSVQMPCCAGARQAPVLQANPGAQSAAEAQLRRQPVPASSQP